MLLERESELASLWGVVERARERGGALAVVEGEAGIGKTSLLEQVGARAATDGFRVLRARGTPMEREFGFGIVRQLFELAVVGAGERERCALLAGAAGFAAPAVGLAPHRPLGADAFAVQHGLYWLACNVAERAPVVLVVDDAQWSDWPSLRWLSYIARRLDGVALALLVAWRTGEPDAPTDLLEALRAEAAGATLTLPALSDGATAALARGALGPDIDARICEACQEATGGNPFFVGALLAALRGGVIAPTVEATRRIRQLGPTAVRRSVLLRMAQLGEPAARLARAVSVLDIDAEPRFAYALARLDPQAGAEAATALESARLLEVSGTLRFAHPILRAAVYEDLPVAARAAEHRRAAELLTECGGDGDRAAVHLLATEPAGDGWVTEQLQRACERALARGAPEMGLSLLERALAEPPAPQLRPALLLAAGRAARILARPEAKTYLGEAHREASDPRARSEAASELAETIWHTQPVEAVEVLRSALAGAASGDERTDRLRLELLMTETNAGLRPASGTERDLRDLHSAALPGSALRQGAACVLLWHDELCTERPRAEVIAELADELRDPRPVVEAYGADFGPLAMAATVLADRDHFDVATPLFEAVLEDAQQTASAFAVNLAVIRSFSTVLCGNFSEAETDARVALDRATLTGSRTGRRTALLGLVWALTGRGAYDELDGLLAGHGLDQAADPVGLVDAYLLLARSALRRAEGRYREARDDIVHAMELQRSVNPLSRIRIWAPRALAAAGEYEHAHELAEAAVRAARAGGFTGPLGIALHSAGLAGRGEPAVELLNEAAELLERSPWRWEHAESLVDLGAALRRGNHRSESREPLRRGLELAERIGAVALEERARDELIATGARPRKVVRSGVDALTASEGRVAAMAADGLSIAEIAQSLFVTRKTVETHLYAAYRKLDVNTRDGLAVALGARARPKLLGSGRLAVVLCTDILEPAQLERRDRPMREHLAAHHARDIKATKAGFLATFDSPGPAVLCALAMRCLEPRIRVAIHVGEIHTTGGDVLGSTVDIAARILALAAPGEVLMSSTVRDLAADGELNLVHRGEHRFQGAPGRWSLLAVADRGG